MVNGSWQEMVVGLIGFIIVVAILIGLVVLVGSSIDWPAGDEPSDPNAILHITQLSRG
ncbi:hypothetical protein LCGC14_2605890 [marine sediment metagenome]|uniref:Uncharacterized protein n=1 Tax=marine sediment metagenome TaxID=412755 RepID=A0A0F9D031_9ZZZZ